MPKNVQYQIQILLTQYQCYSQISSTSTSYLVLEILLQYQISCPSTRYLALVINIMFQYQMSSTSTKCIALDVFCDFFLFSPIFILLVYLYYVYFLFPKGVKFLNVFLEVIFLVHILTIGTRFLLNWWWEGFFWWRW